MAKVFKEHYVLGIDLGTTSVKVVLVNGNDMKIVSSTSAETKADVDVGCSKKFEQSVNKIFNTLDQLLKTFPDQLKSRVKYIGISGQMHGVVMWKKDFMTWDGRGHFQIKHESMTNLITWQDQRCDKEFLSSLPKTGKFDSLHTGFGIPTMIMMQRDQKNIFQQYDRCGTIQDLLVATLTQNNGKPLISDQNASSWGFYDAFNKCWKKDILRGINFPTNILPIIKSSESIAGKLLNTWHNIPSGCKVGVALGDLEASVLSIYHGKDSNNSAIINISTSIQLTCMMPDGFTLDESRLDIEELEYRPYFGGKFLAVGAGLNGGNCLAFFVTTLKAWAYRLGLQIENDKIWEILLEEGIREKTTDLLIEPTIHGERSSPDKRANIRNITVGNLHLGHVMRSLCRGIIANLHEILPTEILKKYGVGRIYATGSALLRNQILQQEVQKQFKDFIIELCDAGDASYGAALSSALLEPS